jgi:hypothetical protein
MNANFGVMSAIPQNGKIYFTLIQSSSSPSGLGYFFGDPGSQSSKFGAYRAAYECKLTNYSILPVFDVNISLYVIFREVIVPPDSQTGRREGRTITFRQGADQGEQTAPLNQPSHISILLMPFTF